MNLRRILLICCFVMASMLAAACDRKETGGELTPTLRGALVPTRATRTPTQLPTDTPTATAVPTDTPTDTAAPTDTPTDTAAPTDTPTDTAAPTDTPTDTAAPTDTPTATAAPTDTPTRAPSATATEPPPTVLPSRTPTRTPAVPTNTRPAPPITRPPGTDLTYGETISGTVTNENHAPQYIFAARGGEVVTITMSGGDGGLDSLLYLVNAQGDELANNDDYNSGISFDARIAEYTIPEDGLYTIIATRYGGQNGSSSGPFALSLDLISGAPPITTENRIGYGETVSGVITNETYALEYQFPARQGDVVTITLSSVEGNLDTLLRLLNADGGELVRNDDYNPGLSRDSRITEFTIPADGSYTIVATRYGEQNGAGTGPFALTLELVSGTMPPPHAAANAIAYGETSAGEISDAAYEARYTFTGHAADIVDIQLRAPAGDWDPFLLLLDPAGVVIAGNDDDPLQEGILNSYLHEFILPVDGDYTIIATRYERATAGGGGAFEVQLEQRGSVGWRYYNGGPVEFDQPIFGLITPDEYARIYTFTGAANQSVTIAMSSESNELDPYLILLDPEGREIARNDDSADGDGNSLLDNVSLPAAGSYTIVATRYEQLFGATFGAFRLDISAGSGETSAAAIFSRPIRFDAVVRDSVSWINYYTFRGQRGDMVTIRMRTLVPGLDPALILEDSYGREIARNDNNFADPQNVANAALPRILLPADGFYTIQATSFNSELHEGDFELIITQDERPVLRGVPLGATLHPGYSGSRRSDGGWLVFDVVGDVTVTDVEGDVATYLTLTYALPQLPAERSIANVTLNLEFCQLVTADVFATFGPLIIYGNNYFTTALDLRTYANPDAPELARIEECGPVDLTEAAQRVYAEGARYVQLRLQFADLPVLDNGTADAIVFLAPRLFVMVR